MPKYYNYGQSLGVLPTPQYGSSVLKGWYTSPTLGQGTQITSATKAATSTTYYAHWGYRPQFETNGGTYTNFPEALKNVQEGSSVYTITTLPTIEKENCTFDGWYFEGNKISNGAVLNLSSGSHIEARWIEKSHYTVTLQPNGGSLKAGTINPIEVYKGNHIGELPTPTRSGYDFLGWYTDVNDENTRHTYETVINSNVTLTAKWAADEYTITFNPNGGELFDPEHDASQKIAVNKPVKILPGANRSDSTTNYSLDGWFYMDENNVEQKLTLTTPITAELAGQDKTLECYAKWTAAGDLFENAGDNLYGYVVKWYTQSNTYATNVDDNLIIAPQNGDDSLSAMLFAEFDFHETVSQTQSKTLPANSVKILIPKYVFKDKDGNGIGSNNINVGLYKDSSQYSADEKCSFIYKDDDPNYPDYYVVYNYEELKEGVNQNQMFKITYELTPSQIRSVNGGYIDENGYYRYVGDDTESTADDQKYYQANLPIKIMVDRNLNGDYSDALDTDYTKNLGIEMHTKVNATASKTQATLTGGATICSYELGIGNSYICANMRCKSLSANEIQGNFEEFPALMCGWSYTDTEDAVKLIDSGEFNSLLPYNFTVDKDSVYVKPIIGNVDGKSKKENGETNKIGNYVQVSQYNTMQEGAFASAYYSVKFTEDWEGSGRTMMTVDVTTPDGVEASGYYVFFKMKTTLSNVSANGITQTDYVSFTDTTENQSPPIAKQSNLKNGIDKKYAQYYNSIDDKYTAYAQGTTSLVTPSQFATGIKSTVKSESEFVSKDVTVGLNSDYIYNVTFTNNQPAANIVIYDVLANSLDGQQYDWNGEFKSVDISSLSSDELISNTDSSAHMAPKIYYCIKDGDLVEADLDISKTSIWTDVEPTDKSTIKAIAVDCRKDEKGGDYSLKPDKSISFNLQMHSPTSHDENDVYTYNEAHVSGTITGEPFKNVTLTSVLLHYVTPEFHKTSFPQSGTDASHRAGVVIKSTIDYKLAVKNPDETLELHNVVVEDLLDADLTVNNLPKVQMDDEEPVDINKMPQGFISYDISDDSSNGNRKKFTATISSIEAGKTVTLILPATVKENLGMKTPIDNTAKITEVNGNDIDDIISETTYHEVDVTKAKIKKVRSNDEGLAGATLEVYEVNSTNCDSNGNLKMSEGDNPVPAGNPKAVTINGTEVTSFTSTTDVITFNLAPGDYILHEVSAPATYKTAADIPFTIDVEGISHVNGESVDFVKMVDEPAFKIIFHENKPNGTIEERNKEFKIVEPMDLVDNKVTHFYDIPEWAGDEYVFAGWYYRKPSSGNGNYRLYSRPSDIDSYVNTAAVFESNTFTEPNNTNNDSEGNYHLYGKWIPVGTVEKDNEDANILEGDYRGFGLAGVQIRDAEMWDSNYNNADGTGSTPGGMRFVTSLSENLISSIDALSAQKVNTDEGNVDVEYGYAVGTEKNIAQFIDGVGNKWSHPVVGHYKGVNLNEYKLQYKGKNVNGVNTTGKDDEGNKLPNDSLNAANDYRYITNVNCTRGTTNSMGTIQDDHRNFTNYRLYTLVVTYEGNSGSYKDEKIDARAYIRYYDANGKLRVFYNNYSGNRYFGGCMCSFNQVAAMALPQDPVKLAEQQKVED